ncbi:sugar phosphate isomerase/epimerase family protein [Mucilaginibacter panaciglaebae]|uniref:Xylose isomerase-like TIM barrel domain-containing protein n=1 Tax=Mucilaginibacter panaciglaebae TaxID=502331 RepID=A0ABP7WMI6_9SPHI
MKDAISRKNFIKTAAIGMAALPLGNIASAVDNKTIRPIDMPAADDRISLNIFSKHLQWLDYSDMANQAAKLGFEGVDLTVRKGGHVLPERVKDNLPQAVNAVKQAGLKVNSITTDIVDANDLHTHEILETAAHYGIKSYRMGWYGYDKKLSTLENVDQLKKRFAMLAKVNERYAVRGDYEHHTGRFGNSIWDLYEAIKDQSPQWIGCQFDIHHATIDGAMSWPQNLDLIKAYVKSTTIKDFYWQKTGKGWDIANAPLGQGMVNFKAYLTQLKQFDFKGPIIMHYEYPLGGANAGANKLKLPKEQVLASMQADVNTLKSWLKESGLV